MRSNRPNVVPSPLRNANLCIQHWLELIVAQIYENVPLAWPLLNILRCWCCTLGASNPRCFIFTLFSPLWWSRCIFDSIVWLRVKDNFGSRITPHCRSLPASLLQSLPPTFGLAKSPIDRKCYSFAEWWILSRRPRWFHDCRYAVLNLGEECLRLFYTSPSWSALYRFPSLL